MPRNVTMSDVARSAGVSPMTVSNVVNGRSGVSESVRRRVTAHLEASGYRMNVAARNLRAGRSGVIGLAVPELDRSYFGQLGACITAEARQQGYRVAVEETGAGAQGETDAIQLSQALQYDGLILSSVGMDLQQIAGQQSFPLVLLGERTAPEGVDHVAMPNFAGAQAATAHLIAQGARSIAFVGGPSTSEATIRSLRLGGFRAAFHEAGLDTTGADSREQIIDVVEITMEGGRRAGHTLADQADRPDAAFVLTDTVAIGVLRGLHDRGIRVPEDMLIASFDDIPESRYLTPSLTTVSPDHQWTAHRAVEMLLARIQNGSGSTHRSAEIAPFTLVHGESSHALTTPLRTENPSLKQGDHLHARSEEDS